MHLHDLLLHQILLVHLVLLWGLFYPKSIKRAQTIQVQAWIICVAAEGQICWSQWSYTDLEQEWQHVREQAAIKSNSQALQTALHFGKMFP